ncbi:MAG: hypothetical protein ACK5MT_04080 [Actinomycetales bacterium]
MSDQVARRARPARSARPADQGPSDATIVSRFRCAFLALAGGIALGAAVELATLRHWDGVQLVPWGIIACLVCASLLAWRRPGRTSTIVAWLAGLIGVVGSGAGVVVHVASNVKTGGLDATYADRWGQMSALQHWWLAATGGVGPSPPLAPGFLAVSAICLILGTLWLRSPDISRNRP